MVGQDVWNCVHNHIWILCIVCKLQLWKICKIIRKFYWFFSRLPKDHFCFFCLCFGNSRNTDRAYIGLHLLGITSSPLLSQFGVEDVFSRSQSNSCYIQNICVQTDISKRWMWRYALLLPNFFHLFAASIVFETTTALFVFDNKLDTTVRAFAPETTRKARYLLLLL